MNTLRKQLLAFGLAATLGLAASAQTPASPPAGPGAAPAAREGGRGHFDPAKRQERMAQRQEALKQKLQISPGQEPAWNSFTSAMRPPAKVQRPDRAAIEKMSTPERIDHLRALRSQRIAEMDRRGEATKVFYATLSPEQKKVFDTETLRRGGRHHGRGHHPHHHNG